MEQAHVSTQHEVSELWQQLLNILEQAHTQGQYHVLYANLKVTLALLNNVHFLNQLTLTVNNIESIHQYLLTLGHAADEATFREELHRKFAKPFYKIVKAFDPQLKQTLKQAFKDRILALKSRFDYTPFNKKVVSEKDEKEQENKEDELKILKLKFKKEQKERVKDLKIFPTHNCYKVFLDTLVPYIKELISKKSPIGENLPSVNAAYIQQLLIILEDGWYIKQTQLLGHKLLWHSLLPLQNTLDDDRVINFFPEFATLHFNSHQVYLFSYGKCNLVLQAMAQRIKPADALEKILDILQTVIVLNERLTQLPLTQVNCELFKDQSLELQRIRNVFATDENPIVAQKQFSADTLKFLNNILQACVSLLGEPPINMALCVLGSSSRADRRPYSDIELVLLYQQPEHKKQFPAKYQQHLEDWHIKLYLYQLLGLFELAIVNLRESQKDVQGFRLDNSCHILEKELFGTPEQIATTHIIRIIQAIDKTTPMQNHPWLNGESFFALLQPKLININDQYDSQAVIDAYYATVQVFLDAMPTAEDEITILHKFLKLKANVNLHNLKRREIIALSTLHHVLNIANRNFDMLKAGHKEVEIKTAFYKPLAYLALSLKLFYNLETDHPVDIFNVINQKFDFKESAVFSMFNAVLAFIAQLQNNLHLQARQQEECIIWLGDNKSNSKDTKLKAYQFLTPIDYAILDLIQNSIILPLATTLPLYFKKNENEFKNLLVVLVDIHLNYQYLNWLKKWVQNESDSIRINDLCSHFFIATLTNNLNLHSIKTSIKAKLFKFLAKKDQHSFSDINYHSLYFFIRYMSEDVKFGIDNRNFIFAELTQNQFTDKIKYFNQLISLLKHNNSAVAAQSAMKLYMLGLHSYDIIEALINGLGSELAIKIYPMLIELTYYNEIQDYIKKSLFKKLLSNSLGHVVNSALLLLQLGQFEEIIVVSLIRGFEINYKSQIMNALLVLASSNEEKKVEITKILQRKNTQFSCEANLFINLVLCYLGQNNKEISNTLIQGLRNCNEMDRCIELSQAIDSLNYYDSNLIDYFCNQLEKKEEKGIFLFKQDCNRDQRILAAVVLGNFKKTNARAVEALCKAIENDNIDVANAACEAFIKLSEYYKEITPFIIRIIEKKRENGWGPFKKDESILIRKKIILALEKITTITTDLMQVLKTIIKNENSNLSKTAIKIISQLFERDPNISVMFKELLISKNNYSYDLIKETLIILKDTPVVSNEFISIIFNILQNSNSNIKLLAMEVLAKYAQNNEFAWQKFIELLELEFNQETNLFYLYKYFISKLPFLLSLMLIPLVLIFFLCCYLKKIHLQYN